MDISDYTFDEITEGMERQHTYRFSPQAYDAMVSVFGDRSPLHSDAEYARERGFEGTVMHGAILHGFLSNFVGMHFPGRRTLELSVNMRYHRASYLNDEVVLTATVKQKVESARAIVMDVRFVQSKLGVEVATGRVHIVML